MAKQTINNGETGLQCRTKLNENFTEVYDGIVNNKVVPDGGTVGSETTPGAMTVASDGGVEFIGPVAATNLDGILGKDTPAAADVTTLDILAQANDINFGGNYFTQLQNIPDLAAKGEGYWFDGVDDVISITDPTNLDMGTNDFSVLVAFKGVAVSDGTHHSILGKGTNNADGGYDMTEKDGNLTVRIEEPGQSVESINAGALAFDNNWHIIVGVYDRSANMHCYIDGKETGTPVNISGVGDIDTAFNFNIGAATTLLASSFQKGEYGKAQVFNLALTAAEVKALYSGAPVPFKWLKNGTDKPGELRNSGDFVIGAEYIITTRTDGDFQSAGAADDVVGTRFIATATAAGVLDGGDTTTRLGAVLKLEQPGIGHDQWIDTSGNELHGTVSGAIPTNLPANHIERYVKKAVTGETTITIPTGYGIIGIAFDNTTANEVGNLNFGFSDDGQEITVDRAITANEIGSLPLVQRIAVITPGSTDNVYISSDNWNSGSVDFYITLERLV